ncbi:shikimate kinase [Streptomyces sp. NPDC054784]
MSTPVVVLVGPPGAGKSTVGRLLAERLGAAYRDTDDDVVATAGKPIADLFLDDGEAYFRELEEAAVRAALTGHDGVLALGGGAVLSAATRQLLAGLPVAYLEMDVAAAVKRVGLDAPRPLLTINPRKQWRDLMDQRRPLYTEVARAVVSTDERGPEEVARAVLDALELKQV